MKFKGILEKAMKLLRIRSDVGGLEISDSALRYARFDGEKWITASLRLPPGILEGGALKDKPQFEAALRELKTQIQGTARSRRRVGAVVSLSSINVYSQVFSLPMIEGENLEKAIQLNIQMVSPGETSETYSGWQPLGHDEQAVRLEILSAFANRSIVDELTAVLRGAGFMPHSIESRALSLARLLRQLGDGFDPEKPYLLLSLDESGLELLVLRRGQLYFEYFTPWREIYGGEKEISPESFANTIIRNLHQVLNFYNSHWSENLAGIFISTPNLREQVLEAVRSNFSLNAMEVKLKTEGVSPDWYIAFGSGLRGLIPPREDREVSLLGISAREEFRREQVLNFVGFWQVLMPVSLSILLLTFLATDMFLADTRRELESQPAFRPGEERTKEIQNLQARVDEFNRVGAMINRAWQPTQAKFGLLRKMEELAGKSSVQIVRLRYQGAQTVSLTGQALSEENIRSFLEAMKGDPQILKDSVNLPLSEVKPAQDQGLVFSMTFSVTSFNPK